MLGSGGGCGVSACDSSGGQCGRPPQCRGLRVHGRSAPLKWSWQVTVPCDSSDEGDICTHTPNRGWEQIPLTAKMLQLGKSHICNCNCQKMLVWQQVSQFDVALRPWYWWFRSECPVPSRPTSSHSAAPLSLVGAEPTVPPTSCSGERVLRGFQRPGDVEIFEERSRQLTLLAVCRVGVAGRRPSRLHEGTAPAVWYRAGTAVLFVLFRVWVGFWAALSFETPYKTASIFSVASSVVASAASFHNSAHPPEKKTRQTAACVGGSGCGMISAMFLVHFHDDSSESRSDPQLFIPPTSWKPCHSHAAFQERNQKQKTLSWRWWWCVRKKSRPRRAVLGMSFLAVGVEKHASMLCDGKPVSVWSRTGQEVWKVSRGEAASRVPVPMTAELRTWSVLGCRLRKGGRCQLEW